MQTFDIACDMLLGNEGGYVNHPDDPGGATNWGITEAVARAEHYTGDMRALSKDAAKAIYRARYWETIRGDSLPPGVACQVFDAAVNSGVAQAARWLQRALGVTEDGNIGPKTLLAAHRIDPHLLIMRVDAHRLLFIASLKRWPSFGRGWATRIAYNLLQSAQ